MRPEEISSASGGLFSRFFFLLLCGVLLILAVKELASTARFSSLTVFAGRIERGQAMPVDVADRIAADADRLRQRGLCRSDLLDAGITANLYRIDLHPASSDFDRWQGAVRKAEDYLRFAIRCVPANSNSWLRYAAIRSSIAENPREIAPLMHRARVLDPSDNHMLLARLGFWSRFSEATLTLAEDDLKEDLRVLLRYGDRCETGQALRAASPAVKIRIDQVAKAMPDANLPRFSLKCSVPRKPVTGPFKL